MNLDEAMELVRVVSTVSVKKSVAIMKKADSIFGYIEWRGT
jgi:ribosomal protein L32E